MPAHTYDASGFGLPYAAAHCADALTASFTSCAPRNAARRHETPKVPGRRAAKGTRT